MFSLNPKVGRRGVAAVLLAPGFLFLAAGVVGCSTKNYVKAQTAPIIRDTNDLDAKTAADHDAIRSTDERATVGINGAMSAADQANQHALAAGRAADAAGTAANGAANRVDSLGGVIAGLDNYKELSAVSVTFGFDKSSLSAADKKQLDQVATSVQSARGYLLQVTGGTDSVGDANYNYQLSQRRADAVVNYLSIKYGIPPHKFYLVGIGKDVQVATDKTAAGRAKNRRVEVKVLSNMTGADPVAASLPATGAAPLASGQTALR